MSGVLADAKVYVEIDGQLGGLRSALGQAKGMLSSFSSSGMGSLGLVAGGMATLGGSALAAGAAIGTAFVGGAVAAGAASISLAADMEQSRVAFTTLLGSAESAKTVLADLTKFAAETPFELPELTNASQMLLAFGVEQKDLMGTLKSVGDIASGIAQPIGELAEIYGKVKTQGRIYGDDIRQISGRGIPIIQELAKQFGVSEEEVKKLVESGAVGFSNLEQAFKDLTAEGGKFGGMMEAQSQTLTGRWSSFKDALGELGRRFGERLMPAAKQVLEILIEFADPERLQPLIDKVGELADWFANKLPNDMRKMKFEFDTAVIGMRMEFELLRLAMDNVALQFVALGDAMKTLSMPKFGIKTTSKELQELSAQLIKLGNDYAFGVSGAKGKDKSAEGSAAKALAGGAGGKDKGNKLAELGTAFREANTRNPQLKIAGEQLKAQQETNRILNMRQRRAEEIKQRNSPEAKEWREFLKESKGKGIPSYFTPEAEKKRKAAAEARQKSTEASPLEKRRAELRKAEEDRRAAFKAAQANRAADAEVRNVAANKKRKDKTTRKTAVDKQLKAKGINPAWQANPITTEQAKRREAISKSIKDKRAAQGPTDFERWKEARDKAPAKKPTSFEAWKQAKANDRTAKAPTAFDAWKQSKRNRLEAGQVDVERWQQGRAAMQSIQTGEPKHASADNKQELSRLDQLVALLQSIDRKSGKGGFLT